MRKLGIDYGDSRVGIAISDELGITAQGLCTISHNGNDKIVLKKLEEILDNYQVDTIIIGIPINMDGTEGFRVEVTKKFIHKLKCKFNKIKIEEDAEIEYVYKSYNPTLWNKNWKEFQNILYRQIQMLDEDDIILKLDIANFYDNINLSLLEKKLLISVPSEKMEFINMLMYFLRNWNLKNDKYHLKSVGIPQNEFGDQSRLLANFYLQNYDKTVKQICDISNAIYIRYADDQIIIVKDIKKLNNIMYVISRELNCLGLNLNASKVKKYNKETIQILYGIPIFKLIDDKKYDEAVDKFFDFYNRKDVDFNYTSSLKRFLNIGFDKFNMSNRNKLKSIITEYQFVRESNEYYMKKIYNNLLEEEKNDFIDLIYKISEETTYNSFHYNAINFLQKIDAKDNIDKIISRIHEIKTI